MTRQELIQHLDQAVRAGPHNPGDLTLREFPAGYLQIAAQYLQEAILVESEIEELCNSLSEAGLLKKGR